MRTRAIALLALSVLLGGCAGDDAPSNTATTLMIPTTTDAATSTSTVSVASSTTAVAAAEVDLTWTRVADEERVLSGPGVQLLNALVAGGPGLVAVGGAEADGEADGAVWVSSDGGSWARVTDEGDALGGPGLQLITSVTTGGPGLVAVGSDDPTGSPEEGFVDSDAAVWVSPDGLTWTRVPHDETVFGGPEGQRMMSVTAGGPGLVAVGSDYKDGSGWPDMAVWVSSDGYDWTRVPDDPEVFGGSGGQEVLSVTAGGPGLVAVGSVDSYLNAAIWVSEDGYSWTRLPRDPAYADPQAQEEFVDVTPGGPGLVAVGRHGTDARADVLVCVSADGYTWTRLDEETLGGPGGQSAIHVGPWDQGLIVVGRDDSTGDVEPAVWVSADGSGWSRQADVGALGGPGEQEVDATAPWGTGLVAAGSELTEEGPDAVVWLGTVGAR